MVKYIIDPPDGWMYGFPKVCPVEVYEGSDEDIRAWIIEQGYPKANAYASWFYYRTWRQFDE